MAVESAWFIKTKEWNNAHNFISVVQSHDFDVLCKAIAIEHKN